MSSAEDTKLSLIARLASSSQPQVEERPSESVEGQARQSGPKPSTRTTMVAHEVRLNVTGTQRAKSGGGRELFDEETNSVLVHENGGVVELSTVVVPGQLLLLANLELRREVVAQVKRKRAYKPTSCYVELEFAEPAPRFWGMEFSAASALLPKNAKDVEAAALVTSAEAIADEAGEPPVPVAGEVQALRREVEALREQAAGLPSPAKSASVEQDYVPMELTAAEEALLPKPSLNFTMSLPKGRWRFRARGNFTPGFRGGVLRLALFTAALGVTVLGAAWYKHWIPWKSAAKKPSIDVAASGANARKSLPGEVAKEHPEFTNTNVASDTSTIRPSMPVQAPESPSRPAASSGSVVLPAARKTSGATTPTGKGSIVRPTARAAAEPISATAGQNVIVPPKLIKSVRAVASLDDLRDFETGNVVIDAVVGTEGEVHFISVISGPPSLRAPAIAAVKQYRYEPAKRNGQAVPEHVNITIRFRFES